MKNKKKIVGFTIAVLVILVVAIWGIIYWNNNNNLNNYYSGTTKFTHKSDDFYFSIDNTRNIVGEGQIKFSSNTLLVMAEPGIPQNVFEELADEYNAKIVSYLKSDKSGDYYTFLFYKDYAYDELKELSNKINELDFVSYTMIDIVPNRSDISYFPNDKKWDKWEENNPSGNNWGLEAIYAPDAWRYKSDMKNTGVLILDSVFYGNHEDLNFKEIVSKSSNNHGTRIGGIIAATFDNEIGISGISPNSELYGFRLTDLTLEQEMNIISYYIEIMNCKVINISQTDNLVDFAVYKGNPKAIEVMNSISKYYEKRLTEIINRNHEFIICLAAGNQYDSSHRYTIDSSKEYGYRPDEEGEEYGVKEITNPYANIENEEVRSRIIVVGAIQRNGKHKYSMANYSQRGIQLDVVAPGSNIYSTEITKNWFGNEKSNYSYDHGTSFAAPFVSGLASMVFGVNPNLTGEEVKQIIVATADTPVNNTTIKMIDAYKAVTLAREKTIKVVQNVFDLEVYNSEQKIHSNYNLKIERLMDDEFPITIKREFISEENINSAVKNLNLQNGIYFFTITNLDDSTQQETVSIVVQSDNKNATDKVEMDTSFISQDSDSTDSIPSINSEGEKATLTSKETEDLDKLISITNGHAHEKEGFNFTFEDDIDNRMYLSGVSLTVHRSEEKYDVSEPEKILCYVEEDVFQKNVYSLYGRNMLRASDYSSNGRVVWDITGIRNGFGFDIKDVYSLDNNYLKVVCKADYYDTNYPTDLRPSSVTHTITYTAIVKKDEKAFLGYYLIAQQYGEDDTPNPDLSPKVDKPDIDNSTGKMDLTQYIGKDVYEVSKQFENMENVGATSGIEFSNGSIIIGDVLDKSGVDFISIGADCDYSVFGIYYGMGKDSVLEKLTYPEWDVYREDGHYIDSKGNMISVLYENEKIISISVSSKSLMFQSGGNDDANWINDY